MTSPGTEQSCVGLPFVTGAPCRLSLTHDSAVLVEIGSAIPLDVTIWRIV